MYAMDATPQMVQQHSVANIFILSQSGWELRLLLMPCSVSSILSVSIKQSIIIIIIIRGLDIYIIHPLPF